MTTLTAGDLVRYKNTEANGHQEMVVTQVSGNSAHCSWYDDDGDHTFRIIPAAELETSVEAHRRAKVMNERAKARQDAEKAEADAEKAIADSALDVIQARQEAEAEAAKAARSE